MDQETVKLQARLYIYTTKNGMSVVPLHSGMTLGRKTDQSAADIQIDSPIVSRKHGEFLFDGRKFVYRDQGSTNGTYINRILRGKKAKDGIFEQELKNGDILRIDLGFRTHHDEAAVIIIFTLDCTAGADWQELPLTGTSSEINIGRSSRLNAGVKIHNDMVSRKHASFFTAKDGWAVVDHQSLNGVYVNGNRIGEPVYLHPFDVVRIVCYYFIFLGDRILFSSGTVQNENAPSASGAHRSTAAAVPERQADDNPLVIRIAERSVWQNFRKLTLLKDINLTIGSGEMVMVLGGSGAGKTTFMNAVMGYEKAKGTILHGNVNIYTEYQRMQYEIGFVPQQDLLRGNDTVYDTLQNAAVMKMPKSAGPEVRRERIAEVMHLLGLEREQNSLVVKLSGGQRKRLSIAVEYIADPSLFFLDEPDSGLDGIMARSLMKDLRMIADTGKIVMVITHAPDRSAELFNKVIVLAKGTEDNCGHLAFFGSVSEALAFFEVKDLESVVRRVNRPDEGGDGLSDLYIEKFSQVTGESHE